MLIDVSSDNVTQPTQAMRLAMQAAHLAGYGTAGDPAVQELEAQAARLAGKEAALFMATGTQANLVAILCQAQRTEEVILGGDSHIYEQELGGAGAVAGVMLKTWPGGGFPSLDALDAVIAPAYRFPTTAAPKPALVCFENAHNASGGTVLAPEAMSALASCARAAGLRTHLDGARIFNAAAALGCQAADLAAGMDTVMFSLDKGLSAPYGAMLCGSSETIARARRWRRLLGGQTRKAGLMAAAGLVALETMCDRLVEDNARAQAIAGRLQGLEGLGVEPWPVPSNLILLNLGRLGVTPQLFVERLEAQTGVRAHVYGRHHVRFAIHRHIGLAEAEAIISAVTTVAAEFQANRHASPTTQ